MAGNMKTEQQKNYGGLDFFRIAAALLVVTIHTSPLTSFTAGGDFFLTRVLARIAVPFFFMVTGYFTLSRQFIPAPEAFRPGSDRRGFYRQLRKLCLIYAAAIVVYLPLGIYAGHYHELTFGGALRMLFFDGTFYHLWYFPACILGMALVFSAGRFLSLKATTVVSVLLYIVGLFGDSYFGLAGKVPALSKMYEGMFRLFSYTRNGLFLAPLFLVMGIRLKKSHPNKIRQDALCLALSFALMTAEAFLLRHFELQRHDSMYLFLIPVMFFLFRLLLAVPAPSRKRLRSISTWIYLLHPGFIVVVRGAAKVLRLNSLLVENSLVHFLAVACLSTAAATALALLGERILSGRQSSHAKKTNGPAEEDCGLTSGLQTTYDRESDDLSVRELDEAAETDAFLSESALTGRAWIELDLQALADNVRFLQSKLPEGCRLMPALKANAYGHGAVLIARELNRLGIQDFCVACLSEGIELREAGIRGRILLLGYTSPELLPLLERYRLTQTVVDFPYAETLQQSGLKLHVHIAVDTGMHRLGIRCEDMEQIAAVYGMRNLSVDGIFTHLSASDSDTPESRAFTESQIQAFYQVTDGLLEAGLPCRGLHMLASYGILRYPQTSEAFVRPGIALYGLLSTEADTRSLLADNPQACLRPVLSLKARIISVRNLCAGESAGYGLDFVAERDMKIAVISIGYADGLPRAMSNGNGSVLIDGRPAPVVGRVCMDLTLVDVSGISDPKPGDVAVLIGKSGGLEITAAQAAGWCGTIANEFLSRLGARLERIAPVTIRDSF